MEAITKARPTMKFLDGVYNEIINTIGTRPAESGGLLFGKEDDYVVRKFVFDKNARVSRSTYTFNTDFLNPEIKRLWNDEGLSCIGFIHSHPNGYGRLSPPDIEYFSSMFESMPRKHYLTPIVFTTPDGGFKLNAHILPNGSKETIRADVEILPDDYYEMEINEHLEINKNMKTVLNKNIAALNKIEALERVLWIIWKLTMAFGLGYFLLKALYILTHHLLEIYPL
jgi:proteasome lid subunit RPN8/RPN11